MKKKTKKMCRALSVFLAFLIVVQILPLQVLAESITDAIAHRQFINDVVDKPTLEDKTSDAEILYEVEEKRDEYTKVYKKSDGTYTAIMTEEPLHYLNDGVWEEINNSMSLNGNLYTNLDNLFNVELPETIDSNENLTVEKDGYELSFSVDNIEESSAVVENDIVVSDTNVPVADEAIAQTQSSVTYNDVTEDTDLQYIVTPNSIKENIIVSNKESVKGTYTFTFETNGLNAEKLDDGSVIFKDENSEIKFRIPRPVMTDSSLAFSYDINVYLVENIDGTIILEYSPSSEWVNDSDRVYPITIDPAIYVENKDVSWVDDTYVAYNSSNSNIQNTNYYNDYIGAVANMIDEDGIQNRAEVYTKFNIDTLKSLGDNIVFTEVQYLFVGISANGKALAKKITSPVDLTTVTYDTKPSFDDEVIDYYTSPYSLDDDNINFSYIHFNITKPLNEWYNGAENNGFAVIAENEGYIGIYYLNGIQTITSSSGTTTKTYTTAIAMDYVDMGGYNENYNYHSQTVGRAGTGYVNDFTQHLSIIREDLSMDGNIMPVTVGMIYNSATYDKMSALNYKSLMAYGNGWTPNYLRAYVRMSDCNQIIYYTESGSEIDYTYSIENGEVVFDETYSELYGEYEYEIQYYPATSTEAEYITIRRPDLLEERFNSLGLLTSITNLVKPSQKVNIVYDSMFRIDYVTDGVGRKYDYIYNDSTNLLSKIKCYDANGNVINAGIKENPEAPDIPLEVHYTYDENKNLTSITFPDGKSATYTYDTNGNITSINNIDDYRIVYDYDVNGRITKVTEQAWDKTKYENGHTITYERLSPTQIKLIDKLGNFEIYQFNSVGKLIYKTDSNGNYLSNIVLGSNNNSYYIASDDYRTNSENLLLNSSFEKEYSASKTSRAKYWESSSSYFTRTTIDEPYFGNYVYSAIRTTEGNNYQKQTVNVSSGGKYTFSAYVKSDDTNPGKLYLNISSIDDSNTNDKTESISVESTDGKWKRYWITLEAENNTENIVVEFGFKDSKGTFYVDNVQLEHSPSANAYNYVENGNFINNFEDWIVEADCSVVETEVNGTQQKAVSFVGNTDTDNMIKRTVKIDGDEGDIFTIGGWFKGVFVNSSTNNAIIHSIINDPSNGNIFNFTKDHFAQIELSYQYAETKEDGTVGTLTEKIVVPFTENVDDWQFAARDFTLKGECNEVMVAIHYNKNINTALLSNIELTKNDTGIIIDDPETTIKTCKCSKCEEPNCLCTCEKQIFCYCVTCLRKNSTREDDFGNIVEMSSFDGMKTINKLSHFTDDGNYLLSETDMDGSTVEYQYEVNGLLKSITDGNGNTTSYAYDGYALLTAISAININPVSEDISTASAHYTYENDKIVSISHNNFTYNFEYNCWNQLINVLIGTQPIISYSYGKNQYRDRVTKTVYYNSVDDFKTTEYRYDTAGNIKEIVVNGDTEFSCLYDSLGNLTEISKTNSRTVRYTDYRTDILDEFDNYIYTLDIDENGNRVELLGNVKYTTKSLGIDYDRENGTYTDKTDIIAEINLESIDDTIDTSSNTITLGSEITKDWFGRYTESTIKTESVEDDNSENSISAIKSEYRYPDYNNNKTSNRVTEYMNKVYSGTEIKEENISDYYGFSYDYDNNGNIVAEYDFDYDTNERGQLRYSYVYDSLNQLVRFNDNVSIPKRSYTYKYDSYGNMLSKSTYLYKTGALGSVLSTIHYEYENTLWNDKLTKYDNKPISYDQLGNTTSIDGATLEWSGRELKTYTITEYDKNENAITTQIHYDYDENGLIHKKEIRINNILTEKYNYTWASGKLTNQVYTTYETTSPTTYAVKFIYDLLGTAQGFIVNDSEMYLYLKNYQGDIIGVVDESGKTVITYAYDAWGVPSSPVVEGDNVMFEHMKTFLPFRYRGYCYDNITGLYYAQNRYYHPKIGRFINTDNTTNLGSTGTVLGYNLFTYCENNPVMYSAKNKNPEYSSTIISNYTYNKELSKKITGYIYNQEKDETASQLRLGLTNVGPVGCGAVATYNALLLLGNKLEISDIIREYEINGVFLYGVFGIHQASIARFFIERGYEVTISYNVNEFKDIAKKNTANILFFSHSSGGHYVALTWTGAQFFSFNTYGSSAYPENHGSSFSELLYGNRTGRMLISISPKEYNT